MSQKKEIKEKIIEILSNWHDIVCPFARNDSGVCDCDKKRKKLINQILELFEAERKSIKKVSKKN